MQLLTAKDTLRYVATQSRAPLPKARSLFRSQKNVPANDLEKPLCFQSLYVSELKSGCLSLGLIWRLFYKEEDNQMQFLLEYSDASVGDGTSSLVAKEGEEYAANEVQSHSVQEEKYYSGNDYEYVRRDPVGNDKEIGCSKDTEQTERSRISKPSRTRRIVDLATTEAWGSWKMAEWVCEKMSVWAVED
eukprot:scaffold586_cov68-Cylindrotheca_fusiformis.AAC.1